MTNRCTIFSPSFVLTINFSLLFPSFFGILAAIFVSFPLEELSINPFRIGSQDVYKIRSSGRSERPKQSRFNTVCTLSLHFSEFCLLSLSYVWLHVSIHACMSHHFLLLSFVSCLANHILLFRSWDRSEIIVVSKTNVKVNWQEDIHSISACTQKKAK